jgi:hypothetical protein
MSSRCLALLLLALLSAAQSIIFPSACVAQGYLPGSLACSTCTELSKVVGEARASSCFSCCSSSLDLKEGDAPRLFDSAALFNCPTRNNGGVAEFLEKKAKSWSDVKITDDCRYSHSSLVFTNDEAVKSKGAVVHVSVDGWKVEQIEKILTTHLRQ